MCSYTLIDIRTTVVLVKIWMKSDEYLLNIELLNELSPQNIILFRYKMVFPHPITQPK